MTTIQPARRRLFVSMIVSLDGYIEGPNQELDWFPDGLVTEYGPDAPKDPATGSFAGSMGALSVDERGGIARELIEGDLGAAPRCERVRYRSGWLLVFWFDDERGPVVRCVMTLEPEGERLRHVRNYFFSPEVIAEVCGELRLPYRANGYRYWP